MSYSHRYLALGDQIKSYAPSDKSKEHMHKAGQAVTTAATAFAFGALRGRYGLQEDGQKFIEPMGIPLDAAVGVAAIVAAALDLTKHELANEYLLAGGAGALSSWAFTQGVKTGNKAFEEAAKTDPKVVPRNLSKTPAVRIAGYNDAHMNLAVGSAPSVSLDIGSNPHLTEEERAALGY